ncbi:MAG: SCP2 sterol-binding domain-containing protein [Anaerolineae bacterium]|nr:SCP2 sterol-binding domain-containing protein [Anaerolineae bacterium]
MIYTKTFNIHFDPVANNEAVVQGETVRFTVLTSRLLRLEYSPTAVFENRPSQTFWYRNQPVPEFECAVENGHFDKLSERRYTLTTSHLQLNYIESDAGFTAQTLSITLKESGETWQFGSEDSLNLLGTARTLDDVDGALVLEEGLLSRTGYAVYNDTPRLVFNSDGWLEPRQAPEGYLDLYFFGYGQDVDACLQDFARVAGPAPMIPRWALGNWWSRFWAYSDTELLGLMDEFKAHNVPLSVCIVDMDWHIRDTGNTSSGWTGYTWNRTLFPDPPAFITALHERGLKTALNLHPADGVYPHEAQYAEMAETMGIDPTSDTPIPFNITDNTFTRAYFEKLHHPQEADGVDFWWMDWQQGTQSALSGLDPLWWLNHLHFYDLGRNGGKRPFIFSRWGGLGNHRYPIGFSGDTHVSWDSLAFQPYFTATAANVNYGWWSHDIGGHMGGVEEAELFARWVQFGVFSPIFRLHCTDNRFHERRPWGWDAETERVTSQAMRLRHQLIPYLYTMAWRNHTEQLPLVRPLYHTFPAQEPAYHCPDQYLFGSELLAAPFIAPLDTDIGLSRQAVWLPVGDWFDFFSGMPYAGDSWHAVYGSLDEIPVFAKAGAIVPLATEDGVTNPDKLAIHVFPGAANRFDLYEDDGLTSHSLTPISTTWADGSWSVEIGAAEGETSHLPGSRTWVVCFRNVAETATSTGSVTVSANTSITSEYDAETQTLRVTAVSIPHTNTLSITLSNPALAPDKRILTTCQKLVTAFRADSWTKQFLFNHLPALVADPTQLVQYELKLTGSQLHALAEVLTGAGCHLRSTRHSQDEAIVVWNNQEKQDVVYRLAALGLNGRSEHKQEPLPKFGIFTIGEQALRFHEGSQPSVGKVTVAAWFEALPEQIRRSPTSQEDIVVQFDISGENGRSAHLLRQSGDIHLVDGTHANPDVTIAATAADWLSLLNGEITPEAMFLEGKITIIGNLAFVLELAGSINLSPPSTYRSDRWHLELSYMEAVRIALVP